ncbi:hypothetical protein RN001_009765 [Aquatica leii]|uniref:DUF4806 domain-containing protein n=1 Tax=Aquatica leii TaxID=1421715 RepID=A0AAN7SFS9_9COLE|nr:hypothetical protein RN001_009765 [Aquatica leii]
MDRNVNKIIEDSDLEKNYVFIYSVISYDNRDLEAVPSVWLNENKTICYWPPKSSKNITTLIKNCAKPNEDWNSYSCSLIKQYGSYVDAKRKVAKLVDSCSSSSSQEFGKGHRRKKISSRVMSSENSELIYVSPIVETEETNSDASIMNINNVDTNKKIDRMITTVDVLLKEVASLKVDIRENNKLIENFRNASTTEDHFCEVSEKCNLKFPIENLSEFNNMNKDLHENEDLKKEFSYKMKLLSGGKSDDFVKRMLDRCFSKEFATKLAWTSAKGNIPIGDSKIVIYLYRM